MIYQNLYEYFCKKSCINKLCDVPSYSPSQPITFAGARPAASSRFMNSM